MEDFDYAVLTVKMVRETRDKAKESMVCPKCGEKNLNDYGMSCGKCGWEKYPPRFIK